VGSVASGAKGRRFESCRARHPPSLAVECERVMAGLRDPWLCLDQAPKERSRTGRAQPSLAGIG